MDTHQQVTIKYNHILSNKGIYVTIVYVGYSAIEMLELWKDLGEVTEDIAKPQIVGRDFNFIRNDLEKLGGLAVTQHDIMNFMQCINMYESSEIKFTGSSYTWGNGRVRMHLFLKVGQNF